MPEPEIIEVTCAVIIRAGAVLATRRSTGMFHALKWEFPGGKVKEGEDPETCIRREIREELGVEVRVEGQLPSVLHHYPAHSIRLIPLRCTLMDERIALSEHLEYRWISCSELDQPDWLEADLEVVAMVRERHCRGGYSK
jgi:8-oxo-dGTP diphosphatase